MEERYTHPTNGAELRRQDLQSVSNNAAKADDRLLFELLRPLAGSATPDKLIVPYSDRQLSALSGASSKAFIWGNTADAIVHVMPFRAIVGSRTTFATDPTDHLRDMSSGYLVGDSEVWEEVTIAANASGNPRWDLVYATVTPDADGDSETVIVKDPTTGVVAPSTQVINKRTTVTVSVVQGTPAATPTRPSLPSDGAGSYHIALAYVVIPNGFNASSTVERNQIREVAPVATIQAAMGVVDWAPANHQYKVGGTVDTRQDGDDATGALLRPGAYLPPTMTGGAKRTILLQLAEDPSSHQDGDVVDDSIDWRWRYFRWTVYIQEQTGEIADSFASSDEATHTIAPPTGSAYLSAGGYGTRTTFGCGQSFGDDSSFMISAADSNGVAFWATDTHHSEMGVSSAVEIYVRDTDGALVFTVSGTPAANIIVMLEASGQYAGYGEITP